MNEYIVLEIVNHLRSSISSIPYLLSLRLTSSQYFRGRCSDLSTDPDRLDNFNDAVLHSLFISGAEHRSEDFPALCENTYEYCSDPQCHDIAQNSFRASTYVQLHLQGRLATQSSPRQDKVVLFGKLKAAAELLEHALSLQPSRCDAIHRADRTTKIVSRNPIFADASQRILCKAAAFFLGNRRVLDNQNGLIPHGIDVEHPFFWLINAACYWGSESLLAYVRQLEIGKRSHLKDTDLDLMGSKCAPVAIERGFGEMARSLLKVDSQPLVRSRHYPCPFAASIAAGDIETVKHLLATSSMDKETRRQVAFALCRRAANRERTDANMEIFALLWPLTDQTQIISQAYIVNRLALEGDIKAIEFLVTRDALRRKSVAHTRGPYGLSALNEAATGGHLHCITTLLDNGYLEGVGKHRFGTAIQSAVKKALQAGRVDIYLELVRRLSVMKSAERFVRLAAAQDSVPIMQELLEENPKLLQCTVDPSDYVWMKASTIGEAALGCAIMNLKPMNIRFLVGKGARLPEDRRELSVRYLYYIYRKEAFGETQQVLQELEAGSLEVAV